MDKNGKKINERINDKELISVCSSFLEFFYMVIARILKVPLLSSLNFFEKKKIKKIEIYLECTLTIRLEAICHVFWYRYELYMLISFISSVCVRPSISSVQYRDRQISRVAIAFQTTPLKPVSFSYINYADL